MGVSVTFDDLQNIFADVTFMIKGLDPNSADRNITKLVRRAYQEDSQPFNSIDDDTTYYWLTIRDDPTNEFFSERKTLVPIYDKTGKEIIDYNQKIEMIQNRVIEVTFIFYGEKAFDSAQDARMMLVSDKLYRFLKEKDIYVKRDLGGVVYTYEDYEGRWWRRADFTATFNTYIVVSEEVKTLLEVDVTFSGIEDVNVIIKEG